MQPVRSLPTAELSPQVVAAIRRLLFAAFDDFTEDDWDHSLGGRHHLVEDAGEVVAHASVVPRVLEVGGRPLRTGYVEAVATAPARQGAGLGSAVMAAAGAEIRQGYELGALGTGRHSFYERLGWERWQGPTFVRAGGGLLRTAEDDDGVMVLRHGPSAGIDLAAPISCEERAGDDW